MRIGIDIMGGDYAPQKTVHGAILALNELQSDTKVVLFGRKSEILAELKHHNILKNNFEIMDFTLDENDMLTIENLNINDIRIVSKEIMPTDLHGCVPKWD